MGPQFEFFGIKNALKGKYIVRARPWVVKNPQNKIVIAIGFTPDADMIYKVNLESTITERSLKAFKSLIAGFPYSDWGIKIALDRIDTVHKYLNSWDNTYHNKIHALYRYDIQLKLNLSARFLEVMSTSLKKRR